MLYRQTSVNLQSRLCPSPSEKSVRRSDEFCSLWTTEQAGGGGGEEDQRQIGNGKSSREDT